MLLDILGISLLADCLRIKSKYQAESACAYFVPVFIILSGSNEVSFRVIVHAKYLMGGCNTILSAYILYRHLGYCCTHPSYCEK